MIELERRFYYKIEKSEKVSEVQFIFDDLKGRWLIFPVGYLVNGMVAIV